MDEGEKPELRWLERGSGEPVLLLHGLMGQMQHWEGVLDRLAELCRPIALALPLFDPALREASIEALGRHVIRFLDAIEIHRAVIGGNSLGGHVALELALGHADRVSGLILTGSSGLFERGVKRLVPRQPTLEYVRQKMEEVFHDPALVTDAWVESVRALVTTPASALRLLRLARNARRRNLADHLGSIRVPTLLVWGREDRITPLGVAERFRTLLPDVQLRYLSPCGHAPMLEQPAAFTEAVGHWLEATRDRRTRRVPVVGAAR